MATLVENIKFSIGPHEDEIGHTLSELRSNRVTDRFFQRDHTLWKPDSNEIANRLDWLDLPISMQSEIDDFKRFAESIIQAGFKQALLLGMGGSSLAPEVFSKILGSEAGYPKLGILDSTDPAQISEYSERFDPKHTLYIVSSKSGGTVETLSLLKYFYNLASEKLGREVVGEHFVAITDPGSALEQLANQFSFRRVFLNNPNMGGRYSALSHFGLVPAALLGLDLDNLLFSASAMRDQCEQGDLGLKLGALLASLAAKGRDKLTLLGSEQVQQFGRWLEQLVAESTGKDGNGILPIVEEPLADPESYSHDRMFVWYTEERDRDLVEFVAALGKIGHPVVEIDADLENDLGGEFFRWEFATAVACHLLGVNPFDQPNVEASKILSMRLMENYVRTGKLSSPEESDPESTSLKDFISKNQNDDYVVVQAYLPRFSENEKELQQFLKQIQKLTELPTTLGFGPRYLHSTGQLHKGDAGGGLFIQLICEEKIDLPIPDQIGESGSSITFGVLKNAQAIGDFDALRNAGRRVIRVNLGHDVGAGIDKLIASLN